MRHTTSRVLTTSLALPLLTGLGVAMAPFAIAAATPSSITVQQNGGGSVVCDNSANTTVTIGGTATAATSISASAGDTVSFYNGCNWAGPMDLDFIPNAGATLTVARLQTGTLTLVAGTTSIQVKNTSNNAVLATLTVTLSGGGSGGGSGSSSSAAEGPAPWLQSFARASAATTCPSGYGSSWAQWPNGGRGGFVCNRTLVFDGGSYNWVTG